MTGFQYSDRRRREILEAIRRRDGVDTETVMADLTKAAEHCIQLRHEEVERPARAKEVRGQLKMLLKRLESLGNDATDALGKALAEEGTSLEALLAAVDYAIDAQGPRKRGLPPNDSAASFVKHATVVWEMWARSRRPNRSASADGQFYKFVEAAMPEEVRPPTEARGSRKVTGLVPRALKEFPPARKRTRRR